MLSTLRVMKRPNMDVGWCVGGSIPLKTHYPIDPWRRRSFLLAVIK